MGSGAKWIPLVYTQYVNRTHGRVGHLFQGRFKGILVEKEPYLLELAPYLVLNPVRAGMVRRPGKWPWSSYRATAGEDEAPPFLETDWLLRAFGENRPQAESGYRQFVADGNRAASPWCELKNQVYLGSEHFVERMQSMIDPARPSREIPQRQRRPVEKPLGHYASRFGERDQAIAEAYRTGAYSMQTIADYFGVSRMTVSRAVARCEPDR